MPLQCHCHCHCIHKEIGFQCRKGPGRPRAASGRFASDLFGENSLVLGGRRPSPLSLFFLLRALRPLSRWPARRPPSADSRSFSPRSRSERRERTRVLVPVVEEQQFVPFALVSGRVWTDTEEFPRPNSISPFKSKLLCIRRGGGAARFRTSWTPNSSSLSSLSE